MSPTQGEDLKQELIKLYGEYSVVYDLEVYQLHLRGEQWSKTKNLEGFIDYLEKGYIE